MMEGMDRKMTTKRFTRVIGVVGVVLFMNSPVLSQADMRRAPAELGPTFYAEAVAYASEQPNKSRLDVYVQVPHEEIRFLKENDRYLGRYELTLTLLTAAKEPVLEQLWTVDVPVTDFSLTTQRRLYSLTHRTLDVAPGNYLLTLQLRDEESKKTSQIKKSLLVTDFAKDSVTLSDIMLVNRLTTEGERRSIVPIITGNISHTAEGFFVFFELYTRQRVDSVDVVWKVYDPKKNEVAGGTQREAVAGPKSQVFLKIDSSGLRMGTYFLSVEASARPVVDGKPLEYKGVTSRTFNIRATDLPGVIPDLDKAIEQLIYIARDTEILYVREATTEEDKRKRFLEFWAKRDPEPSTTRNELMEEYYSRVAFANQNYTHYLEGWRTDMGMIFIRFGTPDNVERHPFEYNVKPYEIWYYYQLNRQFIFVDETGFGDYRLRYPTTDLWGRVR
jgi:GWxTD domain-containing protein